MKCPYCSDSDARLVTGKEVYPHRADLFSLKFWECPSCKARVGCHGKSDKPLGRLANAHTRKLKIAAHEAFDPLWKEGHLSRTEAYAVLQRLTGLSADECHMGMMTDHMLGKVVNLCREYRESAGI